MKISFSKEQDTDILIYSNFTVQDMGRFFSSCKFIRYIYLRNRGKIEEKCILNSQNKYKRELSIFMRVNNNFSFGKNLMRIPGMKYKRDKNIKLCKNDRYNNSDYNEKFLLKILKSINFSDDFYYKLTVYCENGKIPLIFCSDFKSKLDTLMPSKEIINAIYLNKVSKIMLSDKDRKFLLR